jgi:hypothetical protein
MQNWITIRLNIKKKAQQPNIVPPENAFIMSLLFRQEVLHDPQFFLGTIIDAERKAAVVRRYLLKIQPN